MPEGLRLRKNLPLQKDSAYQTTNFTFQNGPAKKDSNCNKKLFVYNDDSNKKVCMKKKQNLRIKKTLKINMTSSTKKLYLQKGLFVRTKHSTCHNRHKFFLKFNTGIFIENLANFAFSNVDPCEPLLFTEDIEKEENFRPKDIFTLNHNLQGL